MDAHSKSATRRTASPSTKSHESASNLVLSAAMHASLLAQLGGYTLEQLEQDCRTLMKRTAAAAVELGKRLLMIKVIIGHGQWMDALTRIGIGQSSANKLMKSAIRFGDLGGCPALINAVDGTGKLFELLALNDEEIQSIEAGGTRHGVSVSNLPAMTIKQLRAALRDNAPVKAASNASSTTHLNTALKAGNRTRSTITGRTGTVVRTYTDGSASVCWDEGEPQAEGFGHERMPRCMLELVEVAESATAPLPPSASPILGASPATKPTSHLSSADDPEHYPAVYTLLPGDFDGRPFGIVRYNGHIWLIAEEVAALIGMTPEATREMLAMIDGDLVNEFPTDSIAKVRIATTSTVLRLLNSRAIQKLWIVSESPEAEALAQWIVGEESPPNQPTALTPIASAKLVPTVRESLDALHDFHYDVINKLFQIEGQAKAISKIAIANEQPSTEVSLFGTLADTALKLLVEMNDMLDHHDLVQFDLRARLLTSPGPGEQLPELVWLDLVTELAAEREDGFSNEDMWRLSKIVDTMTRYGEDSPEVTAAWKIVRDYADRNGAVLYDHLYEGEAPGSERVSFRWKPGIEQQRKQKARESILAH